MTEIIDNIRRIGIFVIVARTAAHFAAGKVYEKYIRVITGVIVLYLFLAPLGGADGDAAGRWQEWMGELESRLQAEGGPGSEIVRAAGTPEEAAMERIEEEIRARLDEAAAGIGYRVTDAALSLAAVEDGSGERSWEFERVTVTVSDRAPDRAASDEAGDIRIDRIEVGNRESGDGRPPAGDGEEQSGGGEECRPVFAELLGVAEDKVEVIFHGDG